MQITYYDAREGRNRIKPRYVWGFWAYLLGITSGVLIVTVLF